MKWLKQQNKVEVLSYASKQQARQMSRSRRQLAQRVHARLQRPGTMAWAFAAGVLFGASRDKEQLRNAFDPFRYVNGFALLWSLLAEKQTGAE